MGIIELVLTVIAWRKGWGAIALLPTAVALVVGALLVASGIPEAIVYVCDVVLIGVLGVMAAQGRQELQDKAAENRVRQ